MFKADFIDGKVITWHKESGRTIRRENRDYRPRFYIKGDKRRLIEARTWINNLPSVKATCFEKWRPGLDSEIQKVLRVDISSDTSTSTVARKIYREYGRTAFKYYNVGLSPQFQYCLQEDIEPVPEEKLVKAEIEIPRRKLGKNNVDGVKLGEKLFEGDSLWEDFYREFENLDPDIILTNRGKTLEKIESGLNRIDRSLGRETGFQQLAGENTVSSYGKTVHSSSRYNILGRAVIDRSNSFMLKETGLKGMWDLVSRSYRPIQELAWSSIGRILTSIEIRKAYQEDQILTPWKNWEPEKPKKASKLHEADRGGFIFNPEPEIHRDIFEVDFASLFPNIMVKKNISPETVRCDCCDNSKVPELGYSICQKQRGFISEVLEPLIQDRQEMKEEIDMLEEGEQLEYLKGASSAIKWILVSCFGYMGHAHASFGAMKCHQAIQAFDREIMIETKEIFEENGYRVVHGIIDSLWVEKAREDAEDIEEVCKKATEQIGIKLELEDHFDWIAFTSRKSTEAKIGTLNRYFGKNIEGNYIKAGIETEQSSSCQYTKEVQEEMIEVLDKTMNPAKVCEVASSSIEDLRTGKISTDRLVVERRVSKRLEDYSVENLSTSTIRRARLNGFEIKPGQKARYVVKDRDSAPIDKVRLGFEAEKYDKDFYSEQVIRAAESVISPFSWSREKVRRRIKGFERSTLQNF